MRLKDTIIIDEDKKYKYYKISRSRSNTILPEEPWDVYSKNNVDNNVPNYISANEYSGEFKHLTKPLVLKRQKMSNCLNIKDIIETIEKIKENIANYIKDNRIIKIEMWGKSVSSDELYITHFIVKKAKIRKRKNLATEENADPFIIEIFESNAELEPLSEEELISEYTGYVIIENEGIAGFEKLFDYTKPGENIDSDRMVEMISYLIEESYEAYEQLYILDKFSVVFLTDEKSYINGGDKFIFSRPIKKLQTP